MIINIEFLILQGVLPDVNTFNILIDCFAEIDDPKMMQEMFDQLIGKEIK